MDSISKLNITDKLLQNNEFSLLEANKERIDYVFKNLMSYDMFKNLIQANMTQHKHKNKKNLYLAKNFKIEADLLIQMAQQQKNRKVNLERALQSYVLALLNVPVLHEVRMTASLYERKCQVHLQLGQYEEALYSIMMALDVCQTYNQELLAEVIPFAILMVDCLKKLDQNQMALYILDHLLTCDDSNIIRAHKDLLKMKNDLENLTVETAIKEKEKVEKDPAEENDTDEEEYYSYHLDDRCMIKESPVVGRHFVAHEDIPENTIILKEKPYSIVLESDYLLKKCSSCYKNLDYRFFPCLYCTEIAFCDRNCFEKAYNTFHQHECGMISLVKKATFPAPFHVFRMISRIGPMNAYQIERSPEPYSIQDYLQEENQRIVPEVAKTLEEKLRAYKMSSTLWDHNSKNQSNVHHVSHVLFGIEVSVLLDIVHGMSLNEKDYDFMLDFIDMIIVDNRRIIFNVFGWHEYNDSSFRGNIANCQCLVGSLINHSCCPNTNWNIKDGEIQFTTNTHIKKGEEITITYGPMKEISYNHRQERLNHYYFACHCAICLEDARKGKSLKCPFCNDGVVPFDMSLDKEPLLSGNCLLCFNKYPDFEANIELYKKCLSYLKELNNIIPIYQDLTLLNEAEQYVRKFLSLSTTSPNPNINKVLMYLIRILKFCDEFSFLDDKLRLIQLIDSGLPLEMETWDFYTLNNLFYCFDSILTFVNSNKFSHEPEIRKMLIRFQERIKKILETNENDPNVGFIVNHLKEDLNVKVNEISLSNS